MKDLFKFMEVSLQAAYNGRTYEEQRMYNLSKSAIDFFVPKEVQKLILDAAEIIEPDAANIAESYFDSLCKYLVRYPQESSKNR
jgi:hypothetical protein